MSRICLQLMFVLALLAFGSAEKERKHPLIKFLNDSINKDVHNLEDTWRFPTRYHGPEPLEVICEQIRKRAPDMANQILYTISEHAGRLKECVQIYLMASVGGSPELRQGKIDIDFVAVSQIINIPANIEFLYPHDIENLCLLAPKAPTEQSSLLSTVSLFLWMVVLASFILCYIAVVTIHRETTVYALIEVFRTLITGGFENRLSCLVWVSILSFFLSNTIGGSLTGSIVTPGRNKELDTMQEVLNSVETIFCDGWDFNRVMALRRLKGVTGAIAKKTEMAYLLMNKWGKNLKNRVFLKNSSYAVLSTEINLFLAEHHINNTKNGFSIFHRVQECVLTPGYVSFPVRKNWRHKEYVNALLQRMVEAGVVAKIRDKYMADRMGTFKRLVGRRNVVKVLRVDGQEPVTPLPLFFLKEGFVFGAAGLAIATLVFLLEVVAGWSARLLSRLRRLGSRVSEMPRRLRDRYRRVKCRNICRRKL